MGEYLSSNLKAGVSETQQLVELVHVDVAIVVDIVSEVLLIVVAHHEVGLLLLLLRFRSVGHCCSCW